MVHGFSPLSVSLPHVSHLPVVVLLHCVAVHGLGPVPVYLPHVPHLLVVALELDMVGPFLADAVWVFLLTLLESLVMLAVFERA